MFKKPNYTQTPNEFFDDIAKTLKEGELRILLVIMRQTFGWGNKKWDRISISQFAEKTGMDERSISRSLKTLIEKKLVIKISKGPEGEQQSWYSLMVENPAEFQDPIDDSNNFNPCPKVSPPPDLKSDTKETLTKENMSVDSPAPLFPPLSRANAAQEARPRSTRSKETPREAAEMAHKLFEKVKAIHPKAKPPNVEAWAKEFDLLNRRDSRSWQEISEMIDWAFENAFWVQVIQSPDALRRNWDKMALQRAPKNNKGTTEKRNREIAQEIKNHLTKRNCQNQFWIGNDFVRNNVTGDTINLDLNSETFETVLCKWYSIKKV